MELYLININLFERGQFQLTLEGDGVTANDGDWKAVGGGAAILGQLNGYWKYKRSENEFGRFQKIGLLEGDDPNFISWVWRRDYHYIAALDIHSGVPYLGGDVFLLESGTLGAGKVRNWKGSDWALEWKIARRFF